MVESSVCIGILLLSAITCHKPPEVSNSMIISYAGVKLNSIIRYKCSSGYELKDGLDQVICQGNGTWSTPPQCLPIAAGEFCHWINLLVLGLLRTGTKCIGPI